MAGIVGISMPGMHEQVMQMIEKINYRGDSGPKVIEKYGQTLGAVWPNLQAFSESSALDKKAVWDCARPLPADIVALTRERKAFALAVAKPQGTFIARDPLGIRPLYYGKTPEGALCFASEVKALTALTHKVMEFPPGYCLDPKNGFQTISKVYPRHQVDSDHRKIARGLRRQIEKAVSSRIDQDPIGCWLSGGLDSSVIAALIRPHVSTLHTFAGGFPGSPDLEYARYLSRKLGTQHHEIKTTQSDLISILPRVIYHLESFDALLVRSSLVNFQVGELASNFVASAFSGEGGDELFAGYDYLKHINPALLTDELIDITNRLHNTALQRVDRSGSAHGLVMYLPFLDLDVVDYALSIPSQFKIYRGEKAVEKWILRLSMEDVLPENILWRPKSKFWEGAGVGEMLQQHAEENISDKDYHKERVLENGWILNTKEELLYYRIFKEQVGELEDLSWMGRTKNSN